MEYANVLEEIVFSNLGNWGLLLIPFIAGIIVSFFSEVINKLTPNALTPNAILLITSTITCAFILFAFPIYYSKIDAFTVLMLLINIAVCFLFYPLMGKRLVGKILQKFEQKFGESIEKI
jgi:uncharacterized membrane protein YjjP (DUF1212 family)